MSSDPAIVDWGFVGASGWAGRYLAPAVAATPGAHGVGVFSTSRERGARFAAAHGLESACSSLEELLADDQIDVVYVSTTNDLHAEQTIAAARAGKHVLCEKPLAVNLDDAVRMCEECERAGVVLGVNQHLRAAPTIAAMRNLIANGAIGEPVAGRIFNARGLPPGLQTWRLERPEAGGGIVLDITVHDADVARFLFADEVAEVTAVTANQGLAASGLADSAMGVMRMRGGQLVSFHDAFTVPHAETGAEVHGTTGSLIGREAMMPDPGGGVRLRRGDVVEKVEIGRRPMYEEAVRRFDAAVRSEGQPLATGEDGVAALAIALAAADSARTGTPISPATKERDAVV